MRGGIPFWASQWLWPVPYFVSERLFVRVSENVRKTVVFLGTKGERGFSPLGTGFLAGIVASADFHFHFVVTADHVLDLAGERDVFVRLNRKDGGSGSVKVLPHRLRHPDNRNDIALVGIE